MPKSTRRRTPRALSIHPRVVGGSCIAEPKNTSAPQRKRTATDAMREHVRLNPADAMSATRLAKLERGAA